MIPTDGFRAKHLPFLTGRIPDIELDDVVVDLDGLTQKRSYPVRTTHSPPTTDCTLLVIRELVSDVALHDARFSYSCLSQKHLEE